MKYASFKLAGIALSLTLAFSAQAADTLRIAADAVPHAEILAFVQKLDPNLKLKVIELSNGVNANELLANR